MHFSLHASVLLALAGCQLAHSWNVTIYDSADCTSASYYEVYPTMEHTKYFEMEGSFGSGMVCTYHGVNGTATACEEQIPVGKSAKSVSGNCRLFPYSHSRGDPVTQGPGECKTPDFDILSVVCYDG